MTRHFQVIVQTISFHLRFMFGTKLFCSLTNKRNRQGRIATLKLKKWVKKVSEGNFNFEDVQHILVQNIETEME